MPSCRQRLRKLLAKRSANHSAASWSHFTSGAMSCLNASISFPRVLSQIGKRLNPALADIVAANASSEAIVLFLTSSDLLLLRMTALVPASSGIGIRLAGALRGMLGRNLLAMYNRSDSVQTLSRE